MSPLSVRDSHFAELFALRAVVRNEPSISDVLPRWSAGSESGPKWGNFIAYNERHFDDFGACNCATDNREAHSGW